MSVSRNRLTTRAAFVVFWTVDDSFDKGMKTKYIIPQSVFSLTERG